MRSRSPPFTYSAIFGRGCLAGDGFYKGTAPKALQVEYTVLTPTDLQDQGSFSRRSYVLPDIYPDLYYYIINSRLRNRQLYFLMLTLSQEETFILDFLSILLPWLLP